MSILVIHHPSEPRWDTRINDDKRNYYGPENFAKFSVVGIKLGRHAISMYVLPNRLIYKYQILREGR